MASKEYWFTSRVDLAAQLLDGSRINFSTVQRKKNRETNAISTANAYNNCKFGTRQPS